MLNRDPQSPPAGQVAAGTGVVGDDLPGRVVRDPRDAESRSVDLACEPDLEQVSSVREFVESYYKTVIHDGDVICRMAVAAHELLENAAKYSKGGLSRLRIQIRGGAKPRLLSVSVSNLADPARIDELKVAIAELGSTADASETYQDHLSRAALRTDGSGLGLARIRAEADMTLVLEFQGDQVCVKAVASLEPEEGP
jgi:hypothetical protein